MQNLFGDSVFDEMILNQALNNRNIQFIEEFTRESVYKAIYLMERIETIMMMKLDTTMKQWIC